jgi:hypothetical protein
MSIMKKLILVATIAILPLSSHPAFAQAAISEPGLYSFYHPGGDLLGTGARSIRSGVGTPGASPSSALAASVPRARRSHKRPRMSN